MKTQTQTANGKTKEKRERPNIADGVYRGTITAHGFATFKDKLTAYVEFTLTDSCPKPDEKPRVWVALAKTVNECYYKTLSTNDKASAILHNELATIGYDKPNLEFFDVSAGDKHVSLVGKPIVVRRETDGEYVNFRIITAEGRHRPLTQAEIAQLKSRFNPANLSSFGEELPGSGSSSDIPF